MKAVVIDLDGTLLNAQKEVSDRNKRCLIQFEKSDIPLMIATARPPRAVRRMVPDEILSAAIRICYNGAMIDSNSDKIKLYFPIETEFLSELVDYLIENEPDHQISVEAEDYLFRYQWIDPKKIGAITLPESLSLADFRNLSPTKILLTGIHQYGQLMARYGSRISIVRTDGETLIQIMALGVSKAAAVSLVAENLNISLQDIVAFGDDYNDRELFSCCGYPVAMGNAENELKVLAKEVTGTCDQSGVAQTLERMLQAGLFLNDGGFSDDYI